MDIRIKSEKGFTGVDITVALIVILLFMSLISVLFFNITKSSKNIDRRSESIYIATEIIESFKSKNYDDVKITGTGDENSWVELKNGKDADTLKDLVYYEVDGERITIAPNLKIEAGYTSKACIYNYVPENTVNSDDLVKVINVKVEYKVGQEIKSVELSTSIVRED